MNQEFTVHLSFRVPECFCKRSNYGHVWEGAESQLITGMRGEGMPWPWSTFLCSSPTDHHCKTSQGDLIFPACICLKAGTGWLLLY